MRLQNIFLAFSVLSSMSASLYALKCYECPVRDPFSRKCVPSSSKIVDCGRGQVCGYGRSDMTRGFLNGCEDVRVCVDDPNCKYCEIDLCNGLPEIVKKENDEVKGQEFIFKPAYKSLVRQDSGEKKVVPEEFDIEPTEAVTDLVEVSKPKAPKKKCSKPCKTKPKEKKPQKDERKTESERPTFSLKNQILKMKTEESEELMFEPSDRRRRPNVFESDEVVIASTRRTHIQKIKRKPKGNKNAKNEIGETEERKKEEATTTENINQTKDVDLSEVTNKTEKESKTANALQTETEFNVKNDTGKSRDVDEERLTTEEQPANTTNETVISDETLSNIETQKEETFIGNNETQVETTETTKIGSQELIDLESSPPEEVTPTKEENKESEVKTETPNSAQNDEENFEPQKLNQTQIYPEIEPELSTDLEGSSSVKNTRASKKSEVDAGSTEEEQVQTEVFEDETLRNSNKSLQVDEKDSKDDIKSEVTEADTSQTPQEKIDTNIDGVKSQPEVESMRPEEGGESETKKSGTKKISDSEPINDETIMRTRKDEEGDPRAGETENFKDEINTRTKNIGVEIHTGAEENENKKSSSNGKMIPNLNDESSNDEINTKTKSSDEEVTRRTKSKHKNRPSTRTRKFQQKLSGKTTEGKSQPNYQTDVESSDDEMNTRPEEEDEKTKEELTEKSESVINLKNIPSMIDESVNDDTEEEVTRRITMRKHKSRSSKRTRKTTKEPKTEVEIDTKNESSTMSSTQDTKNRNLARTWERIQQFSNISSDSDAKVEETQTEKSKYETLTEKLKTIQKLAGLGIEEVVTKEGMKSIHEDQLKETSETMIPVISSAKTLNAAEQNQRKSVNELTKALIPSIQKFFEVFKNSSSLLAQPTKKVKSKTNEHPTILFEDLEKQLTAKIHENINNGEENKAATERKPGPLDFLFNFKVNTDNLTESIKNIEALALENLKAADRMARTSDMDHKDSDRHSQEVESDGTQIKEMIASAEEDYEDLDSQVLDVVEEEPNVFIDSEDVNNFLKETHTKADGDAKPQDEEELESQASENSSKTLDVDGFLKAVYPDKNLPEKLLNLLPKGKLSKRQSMNHLLPAHSHHHISKYILKKLEDSSKEYSKKSVKILEPPPCVNVEPTTPSEAHLKCSNHTYPTLVTVETEATEHQESNDKNETQVENIENTNEKHDKRETVDVESSVQHDSDEDLESQASEIVEQGSTGNLDAEEVKNFLEDENTENKDPVLTVHKKRKADAIEGTTTPSEKCLKCGESKFATYFAENPIIPFYFIPYYAEPVQYHTCGCKD